MVHYRHGISEEIIENGKGLLRKGARPFPSLPLHSAQERKRLDFVIIFVDLAVIGKHASYTTLAGIWSDAVIYSVIHRHGMSHFLCQAALQVDMIIDDRKILLLKTYYRVRPLVYRWKGVIFILHFARKIRHNHISELHTATAALYEESS